MSPHHYAPQLATTLMPKDARGKTAPHCASGTKACRYAQGWISKNRPIHPGQAFCQATQSCRVVIHGWMTLQMASCARANTSCHHLPADSAPCVRVPALSSLPSPSIRKQAFWRSAGPILIPSPAAKMVETIDLMMLPSTSMRVTRLGDAVYHGRQRLSQRVPAPRNRPRAIAGGKVEHRQFSDYLAQRIGLIIRLSTRWGRSLRSEMPRRTPHLRPTREPEPRRVRNRRG